MPATDWLNKCHLGDCRVLLRRMAEDGVRVNTVCTSPPYWGLRDYGIEPLVWDDPGGCEHEWGGELKIHKGGPVGPTSGLTNRGAHQERNAVKEWGAGAFCAKCGAWRGSLGLEPDYRDYLRHMVEVFTLVWDVLADDGTLWLNMGDTYCTGTGADRYPTTTAGARVPAGWSNRSQPQRIRAQGPIKAKDLCLMPARVAIALQEAGWYVRSDIIWHKPNPMPESCTDRPTKSHEYIYLLSKQERYYYDAAAIKEPASDDTHARYARGRSSTHKWAGPDPQPGQHQQAIAKGFEHMRSESEIDRRQVKMPSGWDTGPGHHNKFHREGRAPGVHPKAAPAGSGIRANESFNAAVKDVVEDRNKRTVWTVNTEAFPEAHFATFPRKLIEPCILAGAPALCCSSCGLAVVEPIKKRTALGHSLRRDGSVWICGRCGYRLIRPGLVLDPFMGSGTTAQVAEHLGRAWIGCELQPEYMPLQTRRLAQRPLELSVEL